MTSYSFSAFLPAPAIPSSRTHTPHWALLPRTSAQVPPTRDLLIKTSPNYLVHGNGIHADLRLLKTAGQLWVVKDFSARPWWLRQSIGRWLIRHELAALRKLEGLAGAPKAVTRMDGFALAYHYVEGVPLSMTSSEHLPPAFFRRYEQMVEAMHQRGIAHLNLRHGNNVLVTPDQQPVIIDFQRHLPLRWLPLLGILLRRIDFAGVYARWQGYMLAILRAEAAARDEHTMP